MGLHYQEQDEPEKAQKAWENIKYKHSPKAYAKAQFNLGALFHKQGKLPEAEQTWKNIKREDSPENYTKAQFLLGYSSFKEEQFAKAKEYFQHINFYSIPQDDWMHTTQKFFTIAIIKLIKEDINIAKEFLNHIVLPEYFFARNALQNIVNLEKIRDLLLAIFQSVHNILKNLALGQEIHEYEHQFAHYTRPSTAHLRLSGKSSFRLNTIANVNDPTEGEILNHYLNYTLPESSKQAVFISCFTFNHDSLNQFRLYGKEDGQEASGCSIVLDKDFFHSNIMAIGAAMGAKTQKTNLMRNFKDEDIKSKEIEIGNTKEKEQDKPQDKVEKVIGLLPLYRCIYIDKQNPQYVRLACRDEVTFYREYHQKKSRKQIRKMWQKYQGQLKRKQNHVVQQLNNIKTSIKLLNTQDNKLTEDEVNILNYILLPLRYLVKHAAFQEEQECRMFYITDWGDEHIQTDYENWMYVNYSEAPRKHLRKLYLSPGAQAQEHLFLRCLADKDFPHNHIDTKVCRSSNPFRNG